MNKNQLFLYLLLLTLFSKGQNSNDNYKIKAGINGSIFALGEFDGVITFSNGDSLGSFHDTKGGLFFEKMDTAGNIKWLKYLKGARAGCGGQGCPGIGLHPDKFGNILISALSSDTLHLDSNVIVLPNGRPFLAKYNSNGKLIWYKQPRSTYGVSGAIDVSTDGDGNVYSTGPFSGSSNDSLYYDNLPPIKFSGPAGIGYPFIQDIYTVKFDSSGNAQWIKTIQGGFPKEVQSITTASNGDTYVAGTFPYQGFVTFGSTINQVVYFTSFIAKYNSTGAEDWIALANCGNNGNFFEDLVLDKKENNIYAGGVFPVHIDFGNGTAPLLNAINTYDLFAVKYNTAGIDNWAIMDATTNTPTSYGGRSMGITMGTNNNLYELGETNGPIEFSPLPITGFGGYETAYLVKLDTNDQGLCTVNLPAYHLAEDLTIDSNGNIFVIGSGRGITGGYAPKDYVVITKIGNNCNILWSDSIKQNVFTNPINVNRFNSNLSAIYPNPSTGQFTIETNSSEKQTVHIFDINGRLLVSKIINGTTTIDTGNLPEGVYTLTIKNPEGVVNKKLVIVK